MGTKTIAFVKSCRIRIFKMCFLNSRESFCQSASTEMSTHDQRRRGIGIAVDIGKGVGIVLGIGRRNSR